MRSYVGHLILAVSIVCVVAAPADASVTISSNPTQNMSCSGGVCAPTAAKAVLNVTDLESLLASGSVTVTTTGSGGVQAKDVNVNVGLAWTTSSTLSIDAHRSISINQPISITGLSGLALATNDGGRGGVLMFGKKGSVAFANLSSVLTIDGTAFTLEGSISSLAKAIASNPAGSYALADSYNASQDGTYSNSPITTTLTGAVQGLGNTISNLSIDHQEIGKGAFVIGLFAEVQNTGAVENLRLSSISFTVVHDRFHVIGGVGGLAGLNWGRLFGDQANGSITTGKCCYVGGLAGTNNMGTIANSSAKVRIKTTGPAAGGLVAVNTGTISPSHADGAVKVKGGHGGGLVGDNEGTISQSYATGAVKGGTRAALAGLVAFNESNGSSTGTISNSHATGAVTGGYGAGAAGFVGQDTDMNAVVEESYSTGAVAAGTNGGTGGFACAAYPANVADTYWDSTTSGTSEGTCFGNISGITGLTTQQLQSGLPNGFESTIWAEDSNINDGLPYLINNPPPKK